MMRASAILLFTGAVMACDNVKNDAQSANYCRKPVTCQVDQAGGVGCDCGGRCPIAATSALPSSTCTLPSPINSACRTGLNSWQQTWIVAHHDQARRSFGACPVSYDTEIEAQVQQSEGFIQSCTDGGLHHNGVDGRPHLVDPKTGQIMNENIYSTTRPEGSEDLGTYNPGNAVIDWVCAEQGCWDCGRSEYAPLAGHLTAAVWKDVERIGCAMCTSPTQHAENGGGIYVWCAYASKKDGNVANTLDGFSTNVGCAGDTPKCKDHAKPSQTPAPKVLRQARILNGVTADFHYLKLDSYSCGNAATWHQAGDQTGTVSFEFHVRQGNSQTTTALYWSSAHCNQDPPSSPYSFGSTCAQECKNARACSTKVWPEHCEQGCNQDCQHAQEKTGGWTVLTRPLTTSAETFYADVSIKYDDPAHPNNGQIMHDFTCEFTATELTASAKYCIARRQTDPMANLPFAGVLKTPVWPSYDASLIDELSQPWLKFSIVTQSYTGPANTLPPTDADTTAATAAGALTQYAAPTTDTENADRNTGVSMDTTCDGRCGAFAPMYGQSCSYTTQSEVAALPIGWVPSSPTDCYCSCTTDCYRNGDCCSDYNQCSSQDLTKAGGVVQTQSPTKFTGTATSGDPFTEHAGKRTQFYLPLGQRVPLLQYKDIELRGEAKPSATPEDDQQWFKGFDVRYKGQQMISVEIVDWHKVMPAPGSRIAKGLARAGVQEITHEGWFTHPMVGADRIAISVRSINGKGTWTALGQSEAIVLQENGTTVSICSLVAGRTCMNGIRDGLTIRGDVVQNGADSHGKFELNLTSGEIAATLPQRDALTEELSSGSSDKLADIRDRLIRAKMELQRTTKMREEAGSDEVDIDSVTQGERKALRTSQMPLKTLNITFNGKQVERESTNTIEDGKLTLQVEQDQREHIGTGFLESAWIESPGLGFVLQSSVAKKFKTEQEKIEHIHINLKFNDLNATQCYGVLPEIWGVRPMTKETAKLLLPPKKVNPKKVEKVDRREVIDQDVMFDD